MLIEVNTDATITQSEELTSAVRSKVSEYIGRFSDRVSRIGVQLRAVNDGPGGSNMRCVIEARLDGLEPQAVSDQAETIELAYAGAVMKLQKGLESAFGSQQGARPVAATDRPGLDLGGSSGATTAGTGIGLGNDAGDSRADRSLPGRRPS